MLKNAGRSLRQGQIFPSSSPRFLALAAALGLSILGCTKALPRAECAGDGDCPGGQVCYPDSLCVPAAVAIRRGGSIGDECTADQGVEISCSGGEIRCRMGRCLLPDGTAACQDTPTNALPLFGGPASASPDGTDAVVVKWANAADETPPNALTYLVATISLASSSSRFWRQRNSTAPNQMLIPNAWPTRSTTCQPGNPAPLPR